MPRNVRQISFLACALLVLLRVSIGWQFLYEGIWKFKTQKTARPWSAEGYLANARGPFRDKFRSLVDDPDGLKRLDYKTVVAGWDAWRDRFFAQHPDLDDKQKQALNELLEGPREFRQPLAALPEGVDLSKLKLKYKLAKDGKETKDAKAPPVRYNEKAKRLETSLHLVPEERDALIRMARPAAAADEEGDDEAAPAELSDTAREYVEAVQKLFDRTSKLSLKERLQVLLVEDPERNGAVSKAQGGDEPRPGKRQEYEHLLARYEQDLQKAREAFQQDHLDKQWREILKQKAELVGPVDALTAELHNTAYKLLTVEQSRRGPVPEPSTKITEPNVANVNKITMWGLTICGAALLLGLFSRLAALGAAVLLVLFYLPMPPWPGVPEPPGPEHSLFINKNIIECIACLALVALPTGRWMGLDALIRRLVLRKKSD